MSNKVYAVLSILAIGILITMAVVKHAGITVEKDILPASSSTPSSTIDVSNNDTEVVRIEDNKEEPDILFNDAQYAKAYNEYVLKHGEIQLDGNEMPTLEYLTENWFILSDEADTKIHNDSNWGYMTVKFWGTLQDEFNTYLLNNDYKAEHFILDDVSRKGLLFHFNFTNMENDSFIVTLDYDRPSHEYTWNISK